MMPPPQSPLHPSADGARNRIDVVANGGVCSRVRQPQFWQLGLAAALCCATLPPPLVAQLRAPVDGGRTRSLGQPYTWNFNVGASTGALNDAGPGGLNALVRLGTWRSIGNPVVQGLTFGLEGYGGSRRGSLDGGMRMRIAAPLFRVAGGLDFNATTGAAHPIYSFVHPGRRGGLFGDGTMARLDFMPTRGNSVTFGIEIPMRRDVPTGRTRPPTDRVRVTGPPRRPAAADLPRTPALVAAMRDLTDAAEMIRLLGVPFLGRDLPERRPPPVPSALAELHRRLFPRGAAAAGAPTGTRTIESEARRFHGAVEAAFVAVLEAPVAVGGATAADASGADGMTRAPRVRADAIARAARRILLVDVLLPYDRLLGQSRTPDTILRFGFRAQGNFLRWMHNEGGLSDGEATLVMAVFTQLLDVIELERHALSETWGEPRFVWLPLQYALRPEDHDTQAELDAIVELAVEQRFTEHNFVSYVINEQFQSHLNRTILEARDYHVLVTHDFRGIDDRGKPDEVAYYQTVRGYLAAMTARVREYDSTGTFPTYLILHDQWYYSLRHAPLFLKLLEDPTRHHVRLPRAQREWSATIDSAQAALRAAIAGSSLLQEQRRLFGDDWLRDLVKVHVNVTNRPDPSFWSWTLIPGLPIQDNMLRDHRKLVFYDISEADPNRGQAIYTGAGVGEHYSNETWEDRALLVQGPATLQLKAAVRHLLLDNGFREDRIPHALRPVPRPDDYDARRRAAVAGRDWPLRALAANNGSGFLPKEVNVAKAVLYTLMPSGSVISVPDSFWNSEFWGAALFGASLRGVRVLVIAPSHQSNSVEVPGTQLLSRELLSRMLAARIAFKPHLDSTGGLLALGIFDSAVEVTDIAGKVDAVKDQFDASPWLRKLFGFPPSVYPQLRSLGDRIRRLGGRPASCRFERDERTRIHLKANLFASLEAWSMMTLPDWGDITWDFVLARAAQIQGGAIGVCGLTSSGDEENSIIDVGGDKMQKWYGGLDSVTQERAIFYNVMGSQNQNTRSMLMDAEDALVVAKWPSVIPWLDMISLIGQSHWVETQAEIDRYLPNMGPIRRTITHWGRLAY